MGEGICLSCRAVYDVVMREAQMPFEDHFDCVVSGEKLKSWESS